MSQKHQDIIDLPHYHDIKQPYMSNANRAAQFMPYKSLSTHESSIQAKEQELADADVVQIDYNVYL